MIHSDYCTDINNCVHFHRHWDTFYSYADLEILANAGVSHLRIPVGYWMFDVREGEPFPLPSTSDDEGMR